MRIVNRLMYRMGYTRNSEWDVVEFHHAVHAPNHHVIAGPYEPPTDGIPDYIDIRFRNGKRMCGDLTPSANG